ncbi:hypothetical protein UFOVP143_28 [uncultured Caudovirales phage]|uniref:Uncharacterized protein n=1 Tax=uncultured Caudovirales phage TaxID=2100421 RepID=A0A6J7VPC4_9CAUD|nr:hypothetical protein UFOVP143_28 [uncultured Caudovirales phage]
MVALVYRGKRTSAFQILEAAARPEGARAEHTGPMRGNKNTLDWFASEGLVEKTPRYSWRDYDRYHATAKGREALEKAELEVPA